MTWQKARIIDPDFLPVNQIGRELWVQDRPFYAAFSPLRHSETQTLAEKDYEAGIFEGEWMMTNLGFSNGRRCRVWKASIELLSEFTEDPPFIDVNTGEVIEVTYDPQS